MRDKRREERERESCPLPRRRSRCQTIALSVDQHSLSHQHAPPLQNRGQSKRVVVRSTPCIGARERSVMVSGFGRFSMRMRSSFFVIVIVLLDFVIVLPSSVKAAEDDNGGHRVPVDSPNVALLESIPPFAVDIDQS
ncbi:hypothetical protein HYC85_016388 [Camellia sinensis]|uniref:Transmembrane protein n=1 Tax=Camellia sinensis TaxID=4442 RepID=A0A7J7GZR1_CAMSI|nr:hypothetical protein HYC85_016388 [Camellia sinensis]